MSGFGKVWPETEAHNGSVFVTMNDAIPKEDERRHEIVENKGFARVIMSCKSR